MAFAPHLIPPEIKGVCFSIPGGICAGEITQTSVCIVISAAPGDAVQMFLNRVFISGKKLFSARQRIGNDSHLVADPFQMGIVSGAPTGGSGGMHSGKCLSDIKIIHSNYSSSLIIGAAALPSTRQNFRRCPAVVVE